MIYYVKNFIKLNIMGIWEWGIYDFNGWLFHVFHSTVQYKENIAIFEEIIKFPTIETPLQSTFSARLSTITARVNNLTLE